MFCPATSLEMVASSRRAARREYSGSSAMREAAVWIEMESSSRVEAPSKRPPMVLLATRMAIDVGQAVAAALDGADDLVDVDGFEAAVAFFDLHLRRCFGLGEIGVEVGEGRLVERGGFNGGHGDGPFRCWELTTLPERLGTGRKGLRKAACSPGLPLGGVCFLPCLWACVPAGLRTCRLPTCSGFPVLPGSWLSQVSTSAFAVRDGWSVRSCLPLRGSSGVSPDSLFR